MVKSKEVKTKIVKPEVIEVEQAKRLSKGAVCPWEVRSILTECNYPYQKKRVGCYGNVEEFKTRKQAAAYIKTNPGLIAPILVHVVIPPTEY